MDRNQFVVNERNVPHMDVGGAQIQFLATPERTGLADVSFMRGELPGPGVVPLHSHQDLESFFVVAGEMDVYREDTGWTPVRPGDLCVINSNVKHAWRNLSSQPCAALIVTGSSVTSFLQELAMPLDPGRPFEPPSPEVAARMAELAKKYDHWLGSPEENHAVGVPGF